MIGFPDSSIEQGYNGLIVAGVDEAGRGPWAGPIVAAAVVIPVCEIISKIEIKVNDSKKISIKNRQILFEEITKRWNFGVGIVEVLEIDEHGIGYANKLACIRAVQSLKVAPDVVLIDGNLKFEQKNFISIVKGDQKSVSIAAASIIAKVTRDNIMQELALTYPEYDWQNNKGYGTESHIELVKKYGLSPHHRKSFKFKL